MSEKELLTYMVQAIVDKPEEVRVNEVRNSDTLTLELQVASDELGKVIGKSGRIARSLRTILSASNSETKVELEILE